MSARSYNLNPESAKQANVSNRINETGKYIGMFTRAEAITSKKGTEGIEFSYATKDGQTCDYLTLWTYNTDGKELFGLKMLNAIMTCMRVKTIAPIDGVVEKFENGAKVKTQAIIFPELVGKPIGLLLQKEPYEKNDGSIGDKMNIYACFDAQTELTASEILEQKSAPIALAKIVLTLRDKPMQNKVPIGNSAPFSEANFDDDIPF